MTSDGISTADWQRVHALAVEVANATDEDHDRQARQVLRSCLRELRARYGEKPSILATEADYADAPEESRTSGFQRRQAVSYSISNLLTRNLHDVFGENDPARRRAAVDEIFTEDCVFYEPKGAYRGRDEIDRVAGAIKSTHPDFRYQPIAAPEELGDGGRIQWVSGRPGEAPAYAGTDFIIARDGRIAAVYLFFDKLP